MAPGALVTGELADRLGARLDAWCRCATAGRSPRTTCPRTRGPDVRVDPDTFAVTIDGDLIEAEPATELPMAQRYFLF